MLHDSSANGDTFSLHLNSKELAEVLHANRAIHSIGIVAHLLEHKLFVVVFVPDLTYKLLQDILHGDDAKGSPPPKKNSSTTTARWDFSF